MIVLSRRQQEGQYCSVAEKSAHVPSSALFCRTHIFYLFEIRVLSAPQMQLFVIRLYWYIIIHLRFLCSNFRDRTNYIRLYIIHLYIILLARIRLRLIKPDNSKLRLCFVSQHLYISFRHSEQFSGHSNCFANNNINLRMWL